MLKKIINEIEWQIAKLGNIKSRLMEAQKEVDELEGMIAGKVDITSVPVPPDMLRKSEEADKIHARAQAALELNEENKKKRKYGKRAIRKAAEKLLKPSAKAKKRGPRVNLSDEERKAHKRDYQREYMRKRAAEKRSAAGEAGRQAGRQAGKKGRPRKKKELKDMTKDERKEFMKNLYHQRKGTLRAGLPDGLEESGKIDPAELGLPAGIGGNEDEV